VIPLEWLDQAVKRIEGITLKTPVTYDETLGVYFKWENQQKTGSFKIRGAINKVFSLQEWERSKGLITCSVGNHGQGVALAAQYTNTQCEVFASSHAVPTKIDAIRSLGAKITIIDGNYDEVERSAIKAAELKGKVFVSPYNDAQVIAGQGTIGLELFEQTNKYENIKSLVVPIGGGGLISGIGASLQLLRERPRLIGVQSIASPYFYSLFHKGSQNGVKEVESLADGLAGMVDESSITIPLVKSCVDDLILVTEVDIESAIFFAWNKYHQIIEGSAAVGLAACLTHQVEDFPVVIVVSGGNIQPETHRMIVKKFEEK
jgi:threonine dehydratase